MTRKVAGTRWLTNAPELILCGSDFRLGGFVAPFMPVVRDSHYRVDTNISAYFRFLCRSRNCSPGTLKAIAYILRDWMAFLAWTRRHWTEVTDDVVTEWCEAQRSAGAFKGHRDPSGVKRMTEKVSRIYDFYYLAEHQLGLVRGLIEMAHVLKTEQLGRGLTVVDIYSSKKSRTKAWKPGIAVQGRHPGKGGGRPTPDAGGVEKVMLAGLDRKTMFAGATHGLILALMSDAAPRAAGVAGMTVGGISDALAKESILDRRGPTPVSWRLTEISRDYGARRAIIAGLEDMVQAKLSALFVSVVEKGGKQRELAISIEVFRQILEYVWDQRAGLVGGALQGRSAQHSDALWLSMKTRGGLTAGAIGNIAKIAFNKAKVAGSGHRLRAHAIENELVRQLRLAQVRGGRNHMMNDAILNTAQFAGHLSTLSLRDYANQIRRRQNEVEQQVVGVEEVGLADQLRAISAKGGDTSVQRAVSGLLKLLGLEPLPQRGSRDDVRNLAAIAGAPRGLIHQEPLR